MGNSYLEAKAKLEKYGQEHLLLFYDKLNPEDKEKLLNQILVVVNICFHYLFLLFLINGILLKLALSCSMHYPAFEL